MDHGLMHFLPVELLGLSDAASHPMLAALAVDK
jgi:hypothetical protein